MKQKIMNSTILTNETGRSMVEMLGVLAIVGVLSVGGVYGYGVAMKKHKANELLHQASMLATTVSSQILTDKPLNVQDFGNGKYGTFGTPEKVNDEQFTMQITGMDSAVCEQVAKMAGGMVRKAECSGTTLTLTYNNNLSSDKVAADYNGKKDECVASGRKYCDNDTCIPSSEECPVTGPTCPTGSSTSGTGGSTGIKIDGEMCQCDDENAVYTSNGCEVRTSDTCDDHTTNECGLGYYCQFSPKGCDDTKGSNPNGVCTAVGSGTSIKDGAYLRSPSDNLDWWSAYSWCKGNGMEPVTETIAGKSLTNGDYCNEDGNGPLYQYFGEEFYFWTGHDKGNSCRAWSVYASSDYEEIGSGGDRDFANYALCQ